MTNQEAIDILIRYNAWRKSQKEKGKKDEITEALKVAIKALGGLGEAVILLRTLAELQNWPPLWKEKEEWEAAMEKIYVFLSKLE